MQNAFQGFIYVDESTLDQQYAGCLEDELADEEDIDGLPLAMKSAASIDHSASGDDQPRMAMAPGLIIGDANVATTRPRWPRSLPPTDASDQESLHSQLLNAPPLGDGAAYAPEREEAAVTESLGDKRKNMTDCRAAQGIKAQEENHFA